VVQFPAEAMTTFLSPRIRVQTGSRAHPVSYSMGTGASFPGIKRPGRKADHSPASTAEVKNTWSYISTALYVFMVWCLVKHMDNFTFELDAILQKSEPV